MHPPTNARALCAFLLNGVDDYAAGLIGYYLVYAIGVRIQITRHEQSRPK